MLAKTMKGRDVTLSQLSKLSGVSKPTIHGWIHGRKVRNFDHLKKIALILKISIHELLYGEPDPFESATREILRELFTGDVRVTIHRIERIKNK